VKRCPLELLPSPIHLSFDLSLVAWTSKNDDCSLVPLSGAILYGLGTFDRESIQQSYHEQYQLALFLLLRDTLPFHVDATLCAFDPLFSPLDTDILAHFKISVLGTNERAQRKVSVPTLVYMPHCERELYENLLRSNWTLKNVSCLFLVGNSFNMYQQIHMSMSGRGGKDAPVHSGGPSRKKTKAQLVSRDSSNPISYLQQSLGMVDEVTIFPSHGKALPKHLSSELRDSLAGTSLHRFCLDNHVLFPTQHDTTDGHWPPSPPPLSGEQAL
jgi:hypothetical protein